MKYLISKCIKILIIIVINDTFITKRAPNKVVGRGTLAARQELQKKIAKFNFTSFFAARREERVVHLWVVQNAVVVVALL